jgi:uncharacterized protein (DUF927 family)
LNPSRHHPRRLRGLLRWQDADGKEHTFAASDADLHGDCKALFGNLASRGLYIVTGKDRVHLIHYLNAVEVTDRVTEVATTGWHTVGDKKIFALPDNVIGTVDGETIIVRGAADNNSPFEKRGTLDDWKAGVGKLVADHARAVFAVSAAFAPALLGPLDMEGGGYHSYGKSSIGKTTLTAASASVWGKGASNPGFILGWRATTNHLEASAALHTDVTLPLDELGAGEAHDVARAVYSIIAGVGKGRANREGYARRSAVWRTIILSTGEMRLPDKLIEDKRKPRVGQQVRLVDIPADAGRGFGVFDSAGGEISAQILADKIRAEAQTHYGTAGPDFVRKLIEENNIDGVKAMGESFRNNAPEGADPQVLRVLDRFGLVAAAGELAIAFGIVPWATGAAIEAANVCFNAWFDGRGGAGAGEDMAAIAQVRLFIEKHGEARFEPLHPGDDVPPVRDRAGWRRGEGDARQWLILPETWRTEVCAGLNPTEVAKTLAKRGMLVQDASGKYSRSERIREGQKSKRVYIVTSSIIAEEDDDG